MYTTNTKAGLSAARRIPAPEAVTSIFVPGMANRLVSMGGGGGGKGGVGDTCPNSSSRQELAVRAENNGASDREMPAFPVHSSLGA